MPDNINIVRIRAVANALSELNQTVVFVGGATVSLYVSEAAPEARPTDDVDVIVELASYGQYALLEERLRLAGFVNDVASGVICRYKIHGLTVDIMPTHPETLGFSNRWYPDGFKNAVPYTIDERTTINIFSLPYFLASKLEAFKNRGHNDFRFSSDFEDIVYVLENANNTGQQIQTAPADVQTYLREQFAILLQKPLFEESIFGHLDPHYASHSFQKIMNLLKHLTATIQ
jgi:predicted nucleotidyltransferase